MAWKLYRDGNVWKWYAEDDPENPVNRAKQKPKAKPKKKAAPKPKNKALTPDTK